MLVKLDVIGERSVGLSCHVNPDGLSGKFVEGSCSAYCAAPY